MLSPNRHADATLQYVRERSDRVILFYSGGKDSLVLLDKASKLFKQVVCCFMYFIEDMEHQKPVISYVKKYSNVTLLQYPHWMLSHYIRDGYFQFTSSRAAQTPLLNLGDIEEKVRRDTGIDWVINGAKKSDSLNRNLMLGDLKFDSINEKSKRIYPLSLWKKKDVIAYIEAHRIVRPNEYTKKKSNGIDLNEDTLIFLRDNFPNDYKKMLNQFPLAEKLVFDYEYRQQTASSTEIQDNKG